MIGYQILVKWKWIRYYILKINNLFFDFFDILSNEKEFKKEISYLSRPVVVFVVHKYIPRVQKLAFALSFTGEYSVVLFSSFPIKNENKKQFPITFIVKSSLKTRWLIKKINPFIIHALSNWNFDLAYYIIKNKHKFSAKVVFDDYDVFAGMLQEKQINLYFPTQIKKEKYCLENTDGHCCRSLETQYVKRIFRYKISKRRIFFPEYMWDFTPVNANKKENILVYVGNFNNGILKIAEALQKINWKLEIFSAYNVIDPKIKAIENLTVHKPLKPDELIDVIKQYPVAIQFPGCILDKNNTVYTKVKYKYAASGKIFDYLQAGLNVLISDEEFQLWILKRYGAAIPVAEKDAINDIIRNLTIFDASLRKSVVNYKHLTLKEQSPRLLNFYKNLVSEC